MGNGWDKGDAVVKGMRVLLVARLASLDLLHELPLNLCVVLALSAVMAPLLITFGLKNGTVKTLRDRLNNDPDKLEIIVRASFDRPASWLAALRERGDVGFVIPRTRPLSNEITLKATGRSVHASLEPTGPGDPVLSYAGIAGPGGKEIVVSGLVADDLGVAAGAPISLVVESYGRNARREEIPLTVAGILPGRGRRAAYAPLPILENVERIKDGQPSVSRDSRTVLHPGPVYRGAVLLAEEPLSAEWKSRILSATGLGSLRPLTAEEFAREAGWTVSEKYPAFLASSPTPVADERVLAVLREILRGEKVEILPWNPPTAVTLKSNGKTSEILVAGLSLSPEIAKKWGLSSVPPWGEHPENIRQIQIPDGPVAQEGSVELASPSSMPLASVGMGEGIPGIALVPVELAGILARPDRKSIRFDAATGELVLEHRGYSWMRLYARSIDHVESLRRDLEREGIEVSTEAERIREVAEIDRHLSRIFAALAGVGLVGGMSALVSSLFAGAERKRRDFGIMRMVGLPLGSVALFPVFQGAMISTGSYLVAAGIFGIVSVGINSLFLEQLRPGESFCSLGVDRLLMGGGVTLLLAVASGLLASRRIGKQAPSDSLREP
ncbi:MAG: hypothetical protein M0Q93_04175 [Terrimicrobiaceae bacterium]|nr:hypothetical protein [Terrimicrobiaceae bacterium]